jgi:hypothetical protein
MKALFHGVAAACLLCSGACVPACQTQNTATVFFENRTNTNRTYDIVWDGVQIATVTPAQRQVFVVAANVPHTMGFQLTNSSALACSQSTPTLVVCTDNSYFCTG